MILNRFGIKKSFYAILFSSIFSQILPGSSVFASIRDVNEEFMEKLSILRLGTPLLTLVCLAADPKTISNFPKARTVAHVSSLFACMLSNYACLSSDVI